MAVAHGQRVLQAGEPLTAARAAMVLLHGRGATAEDIMTLAAEVERPGWAYLAPQASGNAWYPNPFTAPLESNEPYLSAALDMVSKLVERVEAHVPAQDSRMGGAERPPLRCSGRAERRLDRPRRHAARLPRNL